MHASNPSSKVTSRQVFAIAGPAMIANLTTPLIGIVSTTAIGRLGDATLLGGVAMASVLFDCMFWLFAFLRMSTVAFTAQSLGAGETAELRAILVRGFIVAAVIGAALIALQLPLAAVLLGMMGGSEGVTGAARTYLPDPDLVGAAGARQLRRARLADRPGPRRAGAGDADRDQPRQRRRDGAAGAGVRRRHCRGRRRRGDRGSDRPRARHPDCVSPDAAAGSTSPAARCLRAQS